MLVQRIGIDQHLDPFAAAGNDREHCLPGVDDPHIMLQLAHVLLRGRLFRERPGQHELGLIDRACDADDPVQRRAHPLVDRVSDMPLGILHQLTGIELIPAPVQVLRREPELDDEVTREVLRLDLAALLPPEPDQRRLVLAHDDPSVGAADEVAAVLAFCRMH
jgi:hypothetical protein